MNFSGEPNKPRTSNIISSVSRNTTNNLGQGNLNNKKRFSKWKIILFAFLAILLGFGAIVLLDKVIMPWYVKLGAVAQVPNVLGIKYEEAEDKLVKLGFEVKKSEPRFDARSPAGTVVMQLPYAGSQTKQGRRIYLTVSRGENLEFVPNLIGLELRQARINLIRVGMDVGEIVYEFCDTIEPGKVSGQSMQPTAMARPGTKVDMMISRGKSVAQTMMPSLIGVNIDDARAKLAIAGLSLGKISYKETESYEANLIIAQSLSAYTSVAQYSYVNVTVAVKPGSLLKDTAKVKELLDENKSINQSGFGNNNNNLSTTINVDKKIQLGNTSLNNNGKLKNVKDKLPERMVKDLSSITKQKSSNSKPITQTKVSNDKSNNVPKTPLNAKNVHNSTSFVNNKNVVKTTNDLKTNGSLSNQNVNSKKTALQPLKNNNPTQNLVKNPFVKKVIIPKNTKINKPLVKKINPGNGLPVIKRDE